MARYKIEVEELVTRSMTYIVEADDEEHARDIVEEAGLLDGGTPEGLIDTVNNHDEYIESVDVVGEPKLME